MGGDEIGAGDFLMQLSSHHCEWGCLFTPPCETWRSWGEEREEVQQCGANGCTCVSLTPARHWVLSEQPTLLPSGWFGNAKKKKCLDMWRDVAGGKPSAGVHGASPLDGRC